MNDHPNMALVMRVGEAIAASDLDRAAELLAEDFVWHYFNPRLPEIAGDYRGLAGVKGLFEKLARHSDGTFTLQPLSITPAGDELVVAHVKVWLQREGTRIETDALVVWRASQGCFTRSVGRSRHSRRAPRSRLNSVGRPLASAGTPRITPSRGRPRRPVTPP